MTPPDALFTHVPDQLRLLVENYWQDWFASCEKSDIDPQSVPLPETGKIWACSDFVARNGIRYPSILLSLLAEGMDAQRELAFYKQQVVQVFAEADNDECLMRALRELRQKEMMRIAWRDLNALASVEVILCELTGFAETVVAVSLERLQIQQAEINGMPVDENGEPMQLLTFAMGKMGGGELNFSSDIDLIFAYPEDGETSGPRKVSHYEFYLAVIRKLVKILDEVTVDGFVFRVDTRLRPFGESGPLAMSFSGLEQYYQIQGRDWERYAMVKAKLITGREEDKQYLRDMLAPFVYRRYLDFAMLEEIREMKAMINAQMQRKRVVNNIKLGPGGIREIEFVAQTLQLIRAGRDPELRERSLIRVLTLLAKKNYLEKSEVEQLIAAYWFLRRLENRLQMLADRQTHVLPSDELSQRRICLAMGAGNWDKLLAQLARHQQHVDRTFQQLVAVESEGAPVAASAFELFWQKAEVSEELDAWLASLGFSGSTGEVKKIAQALLTLRRSPQIKHLNSDSSRMMAQLVLSLLSLLARQQDEQAMGETENFEVFDRVSRILRSLAGRRVYISLLNEYPQVQRQMIRLCRTSEWFSERLARHPILLDGLLVSADMLRQQHDIRHLLALELERVGDDLEQQMERMRQFRHQQVFNVALLDVFYEEPVETVSDRLTELANALLERILQLSWNALVEKHGVPCCEVDGETRYPVMGIVAYGKIGGNELGYDSDLDIIFLHNSQGEKQLTAGGADGKRALDNQQFFARVAQRVIHFLNTRTYSGILYEADTRLRPDGQAGLMVSAVTAFERYQKEKAWTWEHQALIRARFVTETGTGEGNTRIEPEFARIRSDVLRQPRKPEELLAEVVKMREKMRQHLAGKSDGFDIKQDTGGLVDIEFMTQAGVLLYAAENADCIRHTATLELINELTHAGQGRAGWYQGSEAEDIAEAYRYFRKLKNWQNLQCEADDSEVAKHRENVIAVWQRLMPGKESLQ